jgi:hypothetical protein
MKTEADVVYKVNRQSASPLKAIHLAGDGGIFDLGCQQGLCVEIPYDVDISVLSFQTFVVNQRNQTPTPVFSNQKVHVWDGLTLSSLF